MACIKNLSFQILTISRVEKPSRWQLTALKTRTMLVRGKCYVLRCAHLWRGWLCRLSGCGWPRRLWRAPPPASTRHPPACLSQPGAELNLIQDANIIMSHLGSIPHRPAHSRASAWPPRPPGGWCWCLTRRGARQPRRRGLSQWGSLGSLHRLWPRAAKFTRFKFTVTRMIRIIKCRTCSILLFEERRKASFRRQSA